MVLPSSRSPYRIPCWGQYFQVLLIFFPVFRLPLQEGKRRAAVKPGPEDLHKLRSISPAAHLDKASLPSSVAVLCRRPWLW